MNYHKGFIAPLILIIIAFLLAGGAYVYLQNNQAKQPTTAISTVQTSNSQTDTWKTYNNTGKGYSISYPEDTKIDISNLSCVRIDTKEFGSVAIGSSSDACGMVGGVGIGTTMLSETITVNGQQYTASGVKTADNSQSLADFSFTNKIYIRYGVDHLDKSDPRSWKNLGALTDAEYQNALNSAKAIVSTLKAN
ncbi:MAG: hypothetical protein Q8P17_04970 [bacterium]|nr:hypothetical protein [bacterium]